MAFVTGEQKAAFLAPYVFGFGPYQFQHQATCRNNKFIFESQSGFFDWLKVLKSQLTL